MLEIPNECNHFWLVSDSVTNDQYKDVLITGSCKLCNIFSRKYGKTWKRMFLNNGVKPDIDISTNNKT